MSRLDGKFIKPGSIPADRLDTDLAGRFAVVTWEEPVEVTPTTQTLSLQLDDPNGDPIAAQHVLRLTCDNRATLAVGAHGTALEGNGTSDLIARTNAAGQLDLTVSCSEEVVVSVAAGPTQGSPILDCQATADVSFSQE